MSVLRESQLRVDIRVVEAQLHGRILGVGRVLCADVPIACVPTARSYMWVGGAIARSYS